MDAVVRKTDPRVPPRSLWILAQQPADQIVTHSSLGYDIGEETANNWKSDLGLIALKTGITKTDTGKMRVWILDKAIVLEFNLVAIAALDHHNPRSRFTFLNYLWSHGLLVQFTNLGTFLPSRLEYQEYLRWCAQHFKHLVQFSSVVQNVTPGPPNPSSQKVDSFVVTSRNVNTGCVSTYRARHVVLAMGGQRYIPHTFTQAASLSQHQNVSYRPIAAKAARIAEQSYCISYTLLNLLRASASVEYTSQMHRIIVEVDVTLPVNDDKRSSHLIFSTPGLHFYSTAQPFTTQPAGYQSQPIGYSRQCNPLIPTRFQCLHRTSSIQIDPVRLCLDNSGRKSFFR